MHNYSTSIFRPATSSSLLMLLQHVALRYNAAEILEVYLWSDKIKMLENRGESIVELEVERTLYF
jgi:hypothetical protein